ncbi:flavodoxin family protein [Eubacteriaceae bacterium ES3]|nr:flavodoxin family protein [Eubacteriaceae bacterium ES3]
MTKILGICASPRKKSSYTALVAAMESAAQIQGVETELVELKGKKIAPCIHCNKCLKDKADRCTVYEDDMAPLYDKFYEADGILIISPVYDMNYTPQLAAFFSRFRSSWSIGMTRPDFFIRKAGAAMSVGGTRNGGQEAVIQSIHNFYHTQGITVCNSGGAGYAGTSLWSPGDGSTTMDDPFGLDNAKGLGTRLAKTATWLSQGKSL